MPESDRSAVALVAVGTLLLATPAFADFSDLRITEVWPGGLDGDENTHDWIELTNLGSDTIIGIDGLHYRDSPVPDAVPDGVFLSGGELTGVAELLPGESAVFLISWVDPLGFNPTPTLSEAIEAFNAMWGFSPGNIKLGYMLDGDDPETGGPGLSRNGDSVILYDGDLTGSPIVDAVTFPVSDRASYIYNPVTEAFGGLAEVDAFGARAGLLAASDAIPGGLPPIGSPGVVPEPAGVALIGIGLSVLARRLPRGRHE
ncbi:MAG: hypothetical protein AAGB29_14150 [Planctomycetota bacterium]